MRVNEGRIMFTRLTHSLVLLMSVFLLLPIANAQQASSTDTTVVSQAKDTESIDAIITAVYDVISGDAGEARDWQRWATLFVPEASLSAVVSRGEGFDRVIMTPESYAANSGPILERDGFHEIEIHRIEERFGQIAHVFSTYESRRSEQDAEPFARGINSFQLMHDGSRWWVVSIYWQGESESNPIPPRYED